MSWFSRFFISRNSGQHKRTDIRISSPIPAANCTAHTLSALIPPLQLPDRDDVKIQFMSDLHLETYGYSFDIPCKGRYLILAGDIGRLSDGKDYLEFLKRVCGQFERTLLVPGNHEFYHTFREDGLCIARDFETELGGTLKWMNREKVELENGQIIVLGCTLHSEIPEDMDKKSLPQDFGVIGDWDISDHNREHDADCDWLKNQLSEIKLSQPQSQVIVATHYAPSFENTCDPRHPRNDRSCCYCSDLLDEFSRWDGADLVTHFIFGHTHWNTTFFCGQTMVISNQRGLNELQPKIDRCFDVGALLPSAVSKPA